MQFEPIKSSKRSRYPEKEGGIKVASFLSGGINSESKIQSQSNHQGNKSVPFRIAFFVL